MSNTHPASNKNSAAVCTCPTLDFDLGLLFWGLPTGASLGLLHNVDIYMWNFFALLQVKTSKCSQARHHLLWCIDVAFNPNNVDGGDYQEPNI